MTKPITVIGGAYGEECNFPMRQVFRGSGGRAAAILSSLGAKVTFATALDPKLGPEFTRIAKHIGYRIEARARASDIWFRYRYPLGSPAIYPATIPTVPKGADVTSDLAVVFGMVEGRLPVHAKRAVYDPQDGAASKPFGDNGSVADELAIVLSYSEGKALTGETEPTSMARKLLTEPAVSVAIVKCGPRGALVKTRRSRAWIRPFPTSRVYKIGSGDVFSAAFAYAWLIEEQEPAAAAWFASRITAAYVESAFDRFEATEIEDFRAEARTAQRRHGPGVVRPLPKKQIYLAGPFFHTSQQWLVDEVRAALLEMGFLVFSPIHDVGVGGPDEVAPANLAALDKSGLLIALLDGVDAGTIFEVGYARAKKIPVVAIAESVDAIPLTMILGSGCYVTNDLTTGIHAACWRLMGDV
jgi:Nucleoside 2-deoxyribosyltransferase/pfkB family carbohydrate kinase